MAWESTAEWEKWQRCANECTDVGDKKEVVEMLGRGKIGKVFRVRRRQDGKAYALQVTEM